MATSLKALAADADTPGVKKTDLYRVAPHLLHRIARGAPSIWVGRLRPGGKAAPTWLEG